MFENPRRGRQARNFTPNVPRILDLKSSSEQIFSENSRWVRLLGLKLTFVSPQDLVWLPMKYFSRPIQVLSAVNPNR